MCGMDNDYLNQFEPDSDAAAYVSYSDFFKRKYKMPPPFTTSWGWPCEGYLCDWGSIRDKVITEVKGHLISPEEIFKVSDAHLDDHYFINIFLHNHNYHRIHAPTDGIIQNISRIPGDLIFLRPWFYSRNRVSMPAFRNERVTIMFSDRNAKAWLLTLVGGFGVGTIELSPDLKVGDLITQGQELAQFKLGSTVCMACPYPAPINQYLERISVGQAMPIASAEPNSNNTIREQIPFMEV